MKQNVRKLTAGFVTTLALLLSIMIGLAQNPGAPAAQVTAPTGAITGRVLNADGSPAIAMDMIAVSVSAGQKPPAGKILMGTVSQPGMAKATGMTDRTGRFTLSNLAPGAHYVAAGIILYPSCAPGMRCGGRMTPFLNQPVFYPDANTPALAVTGASSTTAEFRLPAPLVSTFRVSGNIIGQLSGSLPQRDLSMSNQVHPQVKLAPAGGRCAPNGEEYSNPGMFPTGNVASDGAFEIRDIPQGAYLVCFKRESDPITYRQIGQAVIDRNDSGLTFRLP